MANRTHHPKKTKRALIAALEKSLGIVTIACNEVGVSRWTFYQYMKTDEEFKREVIELENLALDYVESKLYELIRKGDTAATIFYLKTKGKQRGYIERHEYSAAEALPIPIIMLDTGEEVLDGNAIDVTNVKQKQLKRGRGTQGGH